LFQEVVRSGITGTEYLFTIFEVLITRCNEVDLIYNDYRLAIVSESQAKSILLNIKTGLGFRDVFLAENVSASDSRIKTDLSILQFQFFSFCAQFLTIRNEYEEADKCYEKACEIAVSLFGGKEGELVSSSSSFTVIQESHRRMRVNLHLNRKDVAEQIYGSVKKTLEVSKTVNATMVEQAYFNYANLWYEFGYYGFAKEAYELALSCGIDENDKPLREKITKCESRLNQG
jgi:tetratricopeptide (TPR) repeat protein